VSFEPEPQATQSPGNSALTVAEQRIQHVLASVDTTGLGLEIGPSYNPLLPKSSGARIEILDHATREELITKYRALEIPADQIDQIEEVDYVSNGGSFVETIGRTGVYDYIIGSNVVEHMTDLIGFLQDCDALLKPQGRVSLTVPDLRFCFDMLRPVTGIGDVVDAHHYPRRTHTPGTLLEYTTYSCKRGGEIAWNPADDRPVTFRWEQWDGKDLIQQGLDQSEYHDAHRWTFTPASFSLLIQDLRELGYHSLVEMEGAPPLGFEFFVTLGHRDSAPPPRDRLQLLQQIRSELASVAELDGLGLVAVGLEQALDAAHRETDAHRSLAEQREREIGTLKSLAEQREREIGTLQSLAEQRELAIVNLHKDLEGLISSRSWRVTAPIRKLGAFVRRR
jgi:hypothetical protein